MSSKAGSNFSQSLIKRTNLEIKIISARVSCAKEMLLKSTLYGLRINFTRKNLIKKIEERLQTPIVTLKEYLIYFDEFKIYFSDIDYDNDLLEVELVGVLDNNNKTITNSVYKINELETCKEKADIWILNFSNLINLKYNIQIEYVKDILNEIKINEIVLIAKNSKLKLNDHNKEYLSTNTGSTNTGTTNTGTTNTGSNINNNCSNKMYSNSDLLLNSTNSNQISSGKISSVNSFKISNNLNKLSKSKEIKIVSSGSENLNFVSKNVECSSNKNTECFNCIDYENNEKIPYNSSFSGEIVEHEKIGNINDVINYDTFCEAFFVSGLPTTDAKIISDWESLISPCKHLECSLLPAYKPEILFKYEKKSINKNLIDITNLTANLCFPLGIKICYNNEKNVNSPLKDFVNIVTNEKGEIYFLNNFFYRKELNYLLFQKTYNFDPVREYLKKISNPNYSFKIEKEMNICSNLISRDYKFIPECITFISKFPYKKQIEKCIETIFKIIVMDNSDKSFDKIPDHNDCNFNSNEEISKLISHLVNEVPIPCDNRILKFYIPLHQNPIEISGTYMKELPILNSDLKIIFDEISIENILLIHLLIILEQKVIFVHDDYSKLSEISQSFISLLYPLKWINTYIPVLSQDLIKYLQSFIPFIMGLDENLLNISIRNKFIVSDEDNKIFIVNLNKKHITVSTSNHLKKLNKKDLLKEGIHDYPDEIYQIFYSELKALKKNLDEKKKEFSLDYDKLNYTIREIFTKFMVMIMGDYKNYLSFTDDDYPIFNTDIFVLNRSKKNSKFYQEFIQTQIFKEFLEDHKISPLKKINKNNHFFDYMCIRHLTLINPCVKTGSSKDKRSNSVSNNEIFLKIENLKFDSEPNRSIRSITRENYTVNSTEKTPNIYSFKINQDYDENENKISNSRIGTSDLSITHMNTACNTKYISSNITLTPYFSNDTICKLNSIEVQERLLKTFLDQNLSKRIIHNNFFFKEVSHEIRKYMIFNRQGNNINTISSINNYCCEKYDSSNIVKKTDSVFENYKIDSRIDLTISDSIKNPIDECLRIIFSGNDEINKLKYEAFKKCLGLRQGRQYFANMIYLKLSEECEINNKKFLLNNRSYNDFSRLLFTALLFSEDSKNEYREIKIITQVAFYFYRLDNTNRYYIYEDIIKKQLTKVWQNEYFWLYWFELEIEDEENNVFYNVDDFYFANLLKIANYMNKLGLALKKIKHCILIKLVPKYFNNKKENFKSLSKELEKSLEKQWEIINNK